MVTVDTELWLSSDAMAIDAVWRHPDVWPWMTNDLAPEEFDSERFARDKRNKIFVCHANGLPIGVFAYWQRHTEVWEAHGGVLPEYRGQPAISLARGSIREMFRGGALKIVGELPANHRAALLFAAKCGFRREGVNRKSVLRNGALVDTIYVGACRDEWRS